MRTYFTSLPPNTVKQKLPQPHYSKVKTTTPSKFKQVAVKFRTPKRAAAYDTVGCTELQNETNRTTAIVKLTTDHFPEVYRSGCQHSQPARSSHARRPVHRANQHLLSCAHHNEDEDAAEPVCDPSPHHSKSAHAHTHTVQTEEER